MALTGSVLRPQRPEIWRDRNSRSAKQTRRALSLSRRGGSAPVHHPCGQPAWLHLEARSVRAPACCQMSSSRGVRPPTHPTPALRTRRSLSFRRAARYPTPGPRTNLSSGPGGAPSKWPSCYNDRISSGLLPCPHPPGHGHLHAENPVTAGLQRYLNLHQN